jgi:hypothetical protein
MRKDMSKIIVERPRMGRSSVGLRPGRTRVVVGDDGEPLRAVREPSGKPRKTKTLNENLAPLKRYLAANVGRPWNKVFSEVSEHLKPTSTVQQHVRDHLADFVAIKTRMRAGKVMTSGRWGGEQTLEASYYRYYVHPRTGLLRKNETRVSWQRARKLKQAEAAAAVAHRMRVIDSKTQLHLFDGAWWEVKLAGIGDGHEADVVLRAKLSALPPEELYGLHNIRACAKRQLNKAEKKKLGLD